MTSDFRFAILVGLGAAIVPLVLVELLRRRFRLVQRLAFPLQLASVALGLQCFLTWFDLPQVDPRLERWLIAALVFLLAIVVLQVVGLWFFEVFLKVHRGVVLPSLLPKVAMGLLYASVLVLVLEKTAPEWVDLGFLVTGGAIGSLVLGLALQPILGDFFAGIVLSVEKPFRINDWIDYGGMEGRVVSITWRTTHLRTRDNDDLVVPNRLIANQEVKNYYYPHPLHLERINVGIHYRTPPYRAREALLAAARRVPTVLEKPSPDVYVLEFGESAITYELRVWVEDIARKPRIRSLLHAGIWEELHQRGIVIPFPIRTLELEPRVNRIAVDDAGPPETTRVARFYVEVGREEDVDLSWSLTEDRSVLGRDEGCEVRLHEPRASKEHLEILRIDDDWVVRDLESRFGTSVNEQEVQEKILRPLDRIRVGDTVLVFEEEEVRSNPAGEDR